MKLMAQAAPKSEVEVVEKTRITYKPRKFLKFEWWERASEAFLGREVHIQIHDRPIAVYMNGKKIWSRNRND